MLQSLSNSMQSLLHLTVGGPLEISKRRAMHPFILLLPFLWLLLLIWTSEFPVAALQAVLNRLQKLQLPSI